MCPLSAERVNSVQVRLIAGVIMVSALILAFTFNIFLSGFLVIDFFFRGFVRRFSLLGCGGRQLVRLFKVGTKINAGPKQFAAQIGFFLSVGIFIFLLLNMLPIAQVLALILFVAAGLEAIFGFCLGCHIFPFWVRFRSFRIHKRHHHIVFAAIMALFMSFFMSGIITFFNIGTDDFFAQWMNAFSKAILIAFPTILVVRPVAETLAKRIVSH